MSAGIKPHNLTGFGCPLHYIKAREVMQGLARDEQVVFLVNTGESSDEVAKSLQDDGHRCVVKQQNSLHDLIEVIKA